MDIPIHSIMFTVACLLAGISFLYCGKYILSFIGKILAMIFYIVIGVIAYKLGTRFSNFMLNRFGK